ncbi:hypothetical protein LSO10F_180021 [Candidatus Liberibacter solanacearum]
MAEKIQLVKEIISLNMPRTIANIAEINMNPRQKISKYVIPMLNLNS